MTNHVHLLVIPNNEKSCSQIMQSLGRSYPWSSYRGNALGKTIELSTPHACYLKLGKTIAQRLLSYRALFEQEIDAQKLLEIRSCTNKGWLLGSDQFKKEIAQHANRRIESSGWGGDRRSDRKNQGV